MENKIRIILLLICTYLFTPASLVSANTGLPTGLEVSVEMSQRLVSDPQFAEIKLTVTNTTTSTISFNRRNTILDLIIPAGSLDVSTQGASSVFNAPHIRRIADPASDEISLTAGASTSKLVHLASYFDMPNSGDYSVRVPGEQLSTAHFVSLEASPIAAKQTYAYRACNSVQRSQIDAGFNQAEIIARTAYQDLANTPVSTRATAPRYKRWFGAYSASRYNRVLTAFNKIDNAIGTQQISYDCGCTALSPQDRKFVFAYVYASNPYVINLCDVFWRVPDIGVDSKAGTIIHELSHFLILGGANSANNYTEVYGTSAALALAQNDPLHAVNNAENHGYFAENIPEFKMSASDVRSCTIKSLNSVSSTGQPNTFTFGFNPLSQALDNLDYNIFTAGASFTNTNAISNRGGDSARSGSIADNGQSLMATFVTGPGKVKFDWRVSSQIGADGIVFQILNSSSDVVLSDSISGESNWIPKSFNIPSGGHTILWAYVKDASLSVGQDAAWVDSLVITGAAAGNFSSSGIKDTMVSCSGGITLAPIYDLLIDHD